jgi:hypothetical protein
LVLLEWFEHFRMCFDLNAHREAATAFWRTMVMKEGVEREPWQLEQWSAAIKWSRKRLRLTRWARRGHSPTRFEEFETQRRKGRQGIAN